MRAATAAALPQTDFSVRSSLHGFARCQHRRQRKRAASGTKITKLGLKTTLTTILPTCRRQNRPWFTRSAGAVDGMPCSIPDGAGKLAQGPSLQGATNRYHRFARCRCNVRDWRQIPQAPSDHKPGPTLKRLL